MLGGVDTRFERCRPRRGINGCALVLRAAERLPVYKQGDGVLRLGDTVVRFACSDTSCCTSNYTGRYSLPLHDPAMDIDVMG